MPAASLLPERLVIAASVVLTCTLFWTTAADPVNVIKLSALLTCAAVLVGLVVARTAATRELGLPRGLPAWAGAALLVAFTVSAASAPHTTTALLGTAGRNSGWLAYAAALLLYLGALRAFGVGALPLLAGAVLLGGLFTGAYGLLQRLGVDSVPWNNPFNPVIAALGNPDFASAYLGIAMPLGLWGALHTGWSSALRVGSTITAALCVGVSLSSSAVQGPIAALAGGLVVGLAVILDLEERVRRRSLTVLGMAVFAAATALLVGLAGRGPAAGLFSGISFDGRTWYWRAALRMFQRDPLTGIGLDSYGLFWRQDRPLEAPRQLGGDTFSDSAHSVPLQHLAQGGLVLTLTYAGFVLVVLLALLRGLRRLEGQQRLLVAGFGGAWVAYHVQSLVSIDQVPLLLLHYLLAAGVVVAAGASRVVALRLPGALPPPPPQASPAPGRGRRRPVAPPRARARRATAVDHGVAGVAALGALLLAWLAFGPMRASTAVWAGDAALAQGDGTGAVAAYDRAIAAVPGRGTHWTKKALAYSAGGQPQLALPLLLEAYDRDPAEVAALRTAAQIAASDGDVDAAVVLHRRIHGIDPNNRAVIMDYVNLLLAYGGAAEARPVLERAVADLPQDYDLWAKLGDAHLALGDRAAARSAYERALEIEPQQPTALLRLPELAGGEP